MINNALDTMPHSMCMHILLDACHASKDVLIELIGLEREPDLRTLKLIGIRGYPPLTLFALRT